MSTKRVLNLTFFVLLCFGFGFWIAQHPDLYLKSMQIGQEEIIVYHDDETFLGESLQTFLKNKTHLKLKFTSVEKEKASVWILGFRNAKEMNPEPQKFLPHTPKNISTDFLLSEIEAINAIPLAWRPETKALLLKVILLPKLSRRYKLSPSHHYLLSTLFSLEFQYEMIKQTEWNSLLDKEIAGTPKDRNASHVRNIDLRQISVN